MRQLKSATHIRLEPEQFRRLKEFARQQGKSISAVVRQVIEAGLNTLQEDGDVWERRTRILAEARAVRHALPLYTGDLLGEVRQEQEEDIDRVWRGDA